MDTLRLAGTACLLLLAGAAYLSLLGIAVMPWLLPRRWLPLAPVAAPLVGWAVLVAVGYPLNCALPFQVVVWLLGAGALALLLLRVITRPPGRRPLWGRRELRQEAGWPLACAVITYGAAMVAPMHQGTLSSVIADSDVEHFADVVTALIHFPIGWSVVGQQGLEATPVGLAYHYVHACLSVLTGVDAFTTAQPSHALMLGLAVLGVHIFSRTTLGLGRGAAALAVGLFMLGGALPAVAAFGWGQQTAAAATVPFGLAALDQAFLARDRRSLALGGLAGALAAGSLYLATAPLVAGCALAIAVGAAVRRPQATRQVVARLVAIGALVGVAAFMSHASAAEYLLERLQSGGLRADDVAGRSTHVSTFASLPATLGVAPFDFLRTVPDEREHEVLGWSRPAQVLALWGASLGTMLVLVGVVQSARHRRWSALAVLGVAGSFELYLRLVRPFPYGEFKLLTSVWFLVAGLIALGAREIAAAPFPGLRWGGRLVAIPAIGVFVAGLFVNRVHVQQFLQVPFGAALPEAEMAAARAVARVPPRGASVYVSGQLAPAAAYAQAALLTPNRAGFTSQAVHADYLSRRWRGIVTSLLAFGGRPVYGLVSRHSTELRQPVAPNAADFVLLDEADDPRLYGALPADLARAAGRLRLYRNAHRPAQLLEALANLSSGEPVDATFDGRWLIVNGVALPDSAGALPHPVLPVGDSLPGWRSAPPADPPSQPATPAALAASGHFVVGVQAVRPTYLQFETGGAIGPAQRRMVAIEPGLTWYTSPEVRWPAHLSVVPAADMEATSETGDDATRVLAVLVDDDPRTAESLERSPAGTQWPLLSTIAREDGAGGMELEAWYSYAGPREGDYRTVLRDSPRLWDSGDGVPVSLHPGPGYRTWTADLRPGSVMTQHASDDRQPPRPPPRWVPENSERWLWLEFGPDKDASLHSVPAAELDVADQAVHLRALRSTATVLPLLAAPAPPPPVEDGTLVKGSGDAIYYVDHGRLRWVSSPDVLQRLGAVWRLTTLTDLELARLPIGLPLG